jgi:hypothetical protein
MEKIYGWYSLQAYQSGEKEYVYINHSGQETICTKITNDMISPYKNDRSNGIDTVFCGEVKYFVKML